jgi:hypothetical protein
MSLLLSANTFASSLNSGGVQTGGLRISASGLQTIGSVMTSCSEDNKVAVAIGWTLILVGSLANGGDLAFGAELNNSQTELAISSDSQLSDHSGLHANVKKVLQATEMEAMVASSNPQLASKMAINDFATALNANPERLGKLVISGKTIADQKLNGAQFASEHVIINKEEVLSHAGKISEKELNVISNYLRLRNITVK